MVAGRGGTALGSEASSSSERFGPRVLRRWYARTTEVIFRARRLCEACGHYRLTQEFITPYTPA